jgi:hypothetical protein
MMSDLKHQNRGWQRIVNEGKRYKLVWGWLRLFPGFAQMGMVAATVGSLIVVGVAALQSFF